MRSKSVAAEPTIDDLKKRAHILVIDDLELPAQTLFERDGYHMERWPEVQNMPQLTDGSYDIILLDIQGVGLRESPDLQGLGILQQIKDTNPAQTVLVYSSETQRLSALPLLKLADDVLDKEATYVDYKTIVDSLLKRRAAPGYFIEVMNRELGSSAALAPKAVPKALRAFKKGNTAGLESYLKANLPDPKVVDRVVTVVSIGVKLVGIGVAVFS